MLIVSQGLPNIRPHLKFHPYSSRADHSQSTTYHHTSRSVKSHQAHSHEPYHASLGAGSASRHSCNCPSVSSSRSKLSHRTHRSPSPAGADTLDHTAPTQNSSSTSPVIAPLPSLDAPRSRSLGDSFQESIRRNIVNSHMPHKLFTLPSREIGPYVPDHTLASLANPVRST